MATGLQAIFWGVLTFSLLIVIHEGGHFLAARFFGVKVHEFMIGLPGPALRFHGKKTTYGITAIPLGGYVRIAGMEPGPEDPMLGPVLAVVSRHESADAAVVASELEIDADEADKLLIILADWDAIVALEDDNTTYRSRFSADEADDPGLIDRARAVTYRALPVWKRILVLSSGVVLNLVTAIVVFTIIVASFGYYEQTLTVADVNQNSAAQKVGMQKGDLILEIDGKKMQLWYQVTGALANRRAGDRVAVSFERAGERHDVTATLGKNPRTERGLLGVYPDSVFVKPNAWQALLKSFAYIGTVFAVIAGLFNPGTFQGTVSQSSSVIGASYMAAEAAKAGALDYASIIAALSLSLGVINVFPIPPLDGGKIAIELFELLRGRPLSRKVSLGLSAGGAALLFALIGYLVYADVVRYIVG